MSTSILQAASNLSQPYSFAGTPWEFLQSSGNLRTYPGDAHELVTALLEEYDAEAIVNAGIATHNDAGELMPAPILGDAPLEILLLRERKDAPPYDLITDLGSLVGDDPACFDANRDAYTAARMAKHDLLFVAATVAESAVLRRLGYAATVVAGLESLTGGQLRRLLGMPDGVSGRSCNQRRRLAPIRHRRDVVIVFVAFDFLNLRVGVPDIVQTVVAGFGEIAKAFGFNARMLSIWEPSEAQLEEVKLAATLHDVSFIQGAIRRSLRQSRRDIYSFERDRSRPDNLHSAEMALDEEVRRSRDRNYPTSELADAKDNFDRLFDATVLQPLRNAAEATADPVERPLLLRAIELTEELHRTSPLRRLADVAGTRADKRAPEPLTCDEREQRRQASTQLGQIYRKLRAKR